MQVGPDAPEALEVRVLGREALALAEALAGDAFLDLGWLQPLAEGRSEAWPPGREAWTGWLGPRPVSFLLLDVGPDQRAEVTIGVMHEVRRLGLGRRLLDHGLERARTAGWRELFVRVDERNGAALGLFAGSAFVAEGPGDLGLVTLRRLVVAPGGSGGSAA
ncbi:MAG: GNAT family N-acetyltransferase [Planctomycetota bacterium]